MAWKYVNPGYAELTVDGGTTVEDKEANPLNGVKYVSGGDNKCVLLPAPCPKDLWLKVQSIRGTINYGQIYIRCGSDNGIGFNSKDISIFTADSNRKFSIDNKGKQDICIHWHFDKSNGYMEVNIDGQCCRTDNGNVGDGIELTSNTNYNLRLISDKNNNYWSNIILADYDISDEQIATAKLTDLTGTWDGIGESKAKATAVGQVLSQKIDSADLKTQIEAQSKIIDITGVSLAGLKMEYDSSVVDRMTGVINDGTKDVFTETQSMNSNFSATYNSYKKELTIDDISKLTCSLKAAKA